MTSNPTDLIRRLADEVEADVKQRYGVYAPPDKNAHPAFRREYDRDMAIVHEARRWIAEHGGERETGGWAPIASIIEDGYDVGESSEVIARAVHAYVTEGEPNPFEEEADRLHHERMREGVR